MNTCVGRTNAINIKPNNLEFLRLPAARALIGLFLLFLVAFLIAPRTMAIESLFSMAPFIGILGIAAIGQHLVIQQRGFDLSVAGNMSLAAVIVTALPPDNAGFGTTLIYVALGLAVGLAAGFLNGAVINFFRVPPLVMTIGVNALLMGGVYFVSKGSIHVAPDSLVAAANTNIGPISVLLMIFIAFAIIAAWVIARTKIGRKFIGCAISTDTSRALGVKVSRYSIATYCIAGILFSLAGIMIAGLAVTPSLLSGNSYMLMSVAAVIVGGSPLNGDRGSIIATSVGVIFLIFLNQLVVSLGFDFAIQSIVQAAIILAGVTIPQLLRNAQDSPVKAKPSQSLNAQQAREKDANTPILELSGICKVFGKTIALSGVNFTAVKGEVHAIIGENGAGKSTLISVASGVLAATEGTVKIEGVEISGTDPDVFRNAGVSVAFQHPPLPPHLTVVEALSLSAANIGHEGGEAKAQALIDRVTLGSLSVLPKNKIADLSIGQRHVVEIARALASNPKILVLDEPTEPFKEDDVTHLFALIKKLKTQGVAIIYISHRLNEVEDIADRISVLRDGELVETRSSSEFTRAEIVSLIVGRPLSQVFPPKRTGDVQPSIAMEVKGLSGDRFHDVSFSVQRGEIIGIAGVEGQGQRGLMRSLAGLEHCSGRVLLEGRPLDYNNRSEAREAGVSFVPDDRHHEGLFLSLSVRDNLGAGNLRSTEDSLFIDRLAEETEVEDIIKSLKIRTSSTDATIASLSGGNQQKVLIGREIAGNPRILRTDEPTKGVDIGSKSDIYNKLRELANAGVTVIVSSSDGVELEGVCDRVLVMARGTIAKELSGDHVTEAEIISANLTAGEKVKKQTMVDVKSSGLSKLIESKWLPVLALSLASLVIIYFATSANDRFLSVYNLSNIQVQLATLALIAFGQLFVMLLGEIDFSAGPLTGFVVVLASFWLPEGASGPMLVLASIAIIATAALIGFLQGYISIKLKLHSIVVTLAGFFALQGISLALRPIPGGTISYGFVDTALYMMGPVSAVFALAIVMVVLFERTLFKGSFGRKLRALGSDRDASVKLGLKPNVIVPAAFALNGALIGVAGLVLAATVGVGTGTAGVNYTLMSITAVVLGGTIISGGAGSFIAVLFGAILVQVTFSATAFMQVGVEWQYWMVGLSTLFAAGLFSFIRREKSHA